MSQKLKPKLFSVMKTYTKDQFIKDVVAGLIVAIIALPLSIALAISSGTTPEVGLYTAIIAGFFIAVLGGSRVQIGGPSATFMVVVYGVIAQHGMEGMIITTILAGLILIGFGLLKLGSTIKYIPYPITIGFTSGIAVTIFSSQIKDFFGLNIGEVPTAFVDKWGLFISSMDTMHVQTTLVASLALGLLIIWPRVNRKIPASLISILVTTILVNALNLDVLTIGGRYPDLSSALPTLRFPQFSIREIGIFIQPAFTIAFLCSVESLLSAVVSDGMIGSKHRSNMELIAEGVANIASGLFGGIPATGAIARTVANIKNGGRTPIAGIVHSLTLLLILVFFMPLVKLIPLPTLAAILVMVSYNMSEWRTFKGLLKAPKSDIAVLLTTFILTVVVDLAVAISVGMVLAAFLFMKRMTDVLAISDMSEEQESAENEVIRTISKQVLVYEVNGPFFFGAADKFLDSIQSLQGPSKVLIIKMTHVPFIDATALHALDLLYEHAKSNKTQLLLADVNSHLYEIMTRSNFTQLIGEDHICETLEQAYERANQYI